MQVAPAELEALLLTHPAIKDVAVFGVPCPVADQVPKAYIVLHEVNIYIRRYQRDGTVPLWGVCVRERERTKSRELINTVSHKCAGTGSVGWRNQEMGGRQGGALQENQRDQVWPERAQVSQRQDSAEGPARRAHERKGPHCQAITKKKRTHYTRSSLYLYDLRSKTYFFHSFTFRAMDGSIHFPLLAAFLSSFLLEPGHQRRFVVAIACLHRRSVAIAGRSLLSSALFLSEPGFSHLHGRKPLRLHHSLQEHHHVFPLRREQLQLEANQLLDLLEELNIVLCHHRYSTTCPRGSGGTTHAMNVILWIDGNIKVDDEIHGGNVQASACYVCSYQYVPIYRRNVGKRF